MKVDIAKLPKSEIELKIEVPVQEWQEFLADTAKELSRELKIEGFRPGYAPIKIVEEKIGTNKILEEAAEHCVKKCYVRAILENKIEAIGQPEISITKIPALYHTFGFGSGTKDNPFEFKAKVAVMPEIKLPDYKKIAFMIKKKEISVEEKEVEEAILWLQKSRAKFTLKSGPCQKGDWVEIEYSSPQIENNKKIEDAFILGEGRLIFGFEKNLEGMAENGEKNFFLVLPKDRSPKDLAGKEVEFKVRLKSVQKMELPEISDQFVQGLGQFTDLAALKRNLQDGIKLEKENAESQRVCQEILEKIAKNSEVEIPEALVIREQNRMLDDLKQDISLKLGMTIEDYLTKIKKTEKELLDSFFSEAEKRVKNSLVLKEVSKREGIVVSEQEIKSGSDEILRKYPDARKLDPEKLKDYTEDVIRNEKVFQFLEGLVRQ